MQEAKQAGEQPERTMEIASEGDIRFMHAALDKKATTP